MGKSLEGNTERPGTSLGHGQCLQIQRSGYHPSIATEVLGETPGQKGHCYTIWLSSEAFPGVSESQFPGWKMGGIKLKCPPAERVKLAERLD